MLEILRRVIQEVNAARDLATALRIIVERTQEAMGTEVCSVYLLEESGERYLFMATQGLNQDAVGKVALGRSEGLVGYVGERAEPINLQDAQRHPNYQYIPEIGEDPFHSFLGVPIIHHRTVLGVLVVQTEEARRFSEEEEAFLITLSAQLAGQIVHAQATGAIHQIRDDSRSGAERNGALFKGIAGAPGVAIGRGQVVFPPASLETVPLRMVTDIEREIEIFNEALDAARTEIRALRERMVTQLGAADQVLFEAYLNMLDDRVLGAEVTAQIEQGYWAQGALRIVVEEHIARFERMEDSYLSERSTDVRDVGQRVLAKLQQSERAAQPHHERTVLIGEELSLTMFMSVPREHLAGLVARHGSASSHVAILARALEVPAVIGVEDLPIQLMDDQPIIVDGSQGFVLTHPSKSQLNQYENVIREEELLLEGLEELSSLPSETTDGHRINLWVNTGLMPDLAKSLDRGAEGVGLYRTELHFMMQERFPTEEEQRAVYRQQLEIFAPRPVTMRTLDIGGDKTLPYFPISEQNPFLGWRGIRVTLDHPEIFISQVRAMLRAFEGIEGELRIMLPMITSVAEVEEAIELIERCYGELVIEGIDVAMPKIGVMIEVPAAAYQAHAIARRVDFLSVGSNDLVQYMLAVDRNNSQVASLYQDFHPSVLHALNYIAEAGRAQQTSVGICGELAGNPTATVLLMAMGYDTLSMSSIHLPRVKWVVRSFAMAEAREILRTVLAMEHAAAIRGFVEEQLEKAGLGQLLPKHHQERLNVN